MMEKKLNSRYRRQ